MKTVFVSSTFKDMQYERDAIREITAPVLNDEARKHGDEFVRNRYNEIRKN